ncbi:MAG: PadR family transcriptional regulator [Actinobacteria bacterium]|nr:PadR family transcriptional regulator [Actinomycetota bacterium]
MSLKYALLGFLNYADMTGYELKQHFDNSIQHFWNAKLSQIYPALSQMKKEGLLVMEVEYQEKRPNRKVYKITDAGREELKRWLEEPQEKHPLREPFLVQVFFGAHIEKERIIAIMRRQLEMCREQLAKYKHYKEHFREPAPVDVFVKDAVFWGLTLDAGIKYCMASVEWLEEAIVEVDGISP